MIRAIRLLAALAVAACCVQAAEPPAFSKVWYRSEKGKVTGDLSFSPDALVIEGSKRRVTIPFSGIRIVSLGKMRRDVNTEWIVLGIKASGRRQVVGLRDGRKLGYGQRTGEIYEAILAALRTAGAAQFSVPTGFRPWNDLGYQIALAVPQEWTVLHPSQIFVEGQNRRGETVFSPDPVVRDADGKPSGELLERLARGELRGFWLERSEAGAGMRCAGLSAAAEKQIVERAAAQLGPDVTVTQPAQATPIEIDGCRGVHVEARGRRGDGAELRLDLRAAASGDTLYVLGRRSLERAAATDAELFEAAAASVRFAVAR
ncbi:MAG TPA: hypothetical protein VJS92_05350 [Candidatus Polarisedimenticolaceae bacterium]|nr:hypothetical protein [Candidatus Polarisedimenticolaceae bacterium]